MRGAKAVVSLAMSLLAACALAACSKPEPPEKERPPEPKASSEPRHTELRDAIQAPIDRAKSVEKTTLDAADKQRAEIDAQTGG
jgi:hypothetical protein